MTLEALSIAAQIALPSALFGVVMIGGASPAMARWLGLRRRPFRLGRRSRRAFPGESSRPSLLTGEASPAVPVGAPWHCLPAMEGQSAERRAA